MPYHASRLLDSWQSFIEEFLDSLAATRVQLLLLAHGQLLLETAASDQVVLLSRARYSLLTSTDDWDALLSDSGCLVFI